LEKKKDEKTFIACVKDNPNWKAVLKFPTSNNFKEGDEVFVVGNFNWNKKPVEVEVACEMKSLFNHMVETMKKYLDIDENAVCVPRAKNPYFNKRRRKKEEKCIDRIWENFWEEAVRICKILQKGKKFAYYREVEEELLSLLDEKEREEVESIEDIEDRVEEVQNILEEKLKGNIAFIYLADFLPPAIAVDVVKDIPFVVYTPNLSPEDVKKERIEKAKKVIENLKKARSLSYEDDPFPKYYHQRDWAKPWVAILKGVNENGEFELDFISELDYESQTHTRVPLEVCEEWIEKGDIVLVRRGLSIEIYRKEEDTYAYLGSVERLSQLFKYLKDT